MFVYLHGFASGPLSHKAQQYRRRFDALGIPLEIPALDRGDFTHLTLSGQLDVLRETIGAGDGKPLVLIGSSMGGYLSALWASAHGVAALVLMAPAVNFGESFVDRLSEATLQAWRARGTMDVFHFGHKKALPLATDLLDDLPKHAPWPQVTAPTLVMHGRRDDVVRQDRVEAWVARTPSARLVLFDSGHELNDVVPGLLEETLRFLGGIRQVAEAYPALAAAQSLPS